MLAREQLVVWEAVATATEVTEAGAEAMEAVAT